MSNKSTVPPYTKADGTKVRGHEKRKPKSGPRRGADPDAAASASAVVAAMNSSRDEISDEIREYLDDMCEFGDNWWQEALQHRDDDTHDFGHQVDVREAVREWYERAVSDVVRQRVQSGLPVDVLTARVLSVHERRNPVSRIRDAHEIRQPSIEDLTEIAEDIVDRHGNKVQV